jgi:hypothetical protein
MLMFFLKEKIRMVDEGNKTDEVMYLPLKNLQDERSEVSQEQKHKE